MHGIHIAGELIKKAKEQGDVKKAFIEVGELANISKKDLNKQLKNLADFNVVVKEIPAKVRCDCSYEGKPKITERGHDIVIFECPLCGKTPKILEGDKIILKEVEV